MTTAPDDVLILKGAHVIDPAQGIDKVTDVTVSGGRIEAVGEAQPRPGANVIDLAGQYLTPGWIDIHVHVYGALGFADPDSIGIWQGVTSYVEAGGTSIGTLDECVAMWEGRLDTRFYIGPLLTPFGLIGFNYQEGDPRDLRDIPIGRWLDFTQEHPGLLRYLKINGHGYSNPGMLKVGKGLAQILGIPTYTHIGEFQQTTPEPPLAYEAFRIAEGGDIITHIFHNNLGRILDDDGKVRPEVRDAERRGVLFDIGFGGYNFVWDVAEKAMAQGIVPHVISSDLQQFNVTGPVYSLANVMSVFLRLGMSLSEVVDRVTAKAAASISLGDRAGSLRPGLPADITVFRVETGAFELADAVRQMRKAEAKIVPVMAFKDGRRFDSDLARCLDERSWFMQVIEDRIPGRAARLAPAQLKFLAALGGALSEIEWKLTAPQVDLDKAVELQECFHRMRRQLGLPLHEALTAVYDCFLDETFTMQVGLFLLRLERGFALQRLRDVTGPRSLAA
jgi:dihydroorotase